MLTKMSVMNKFENLYTFLSLHKNYPSKSGRRKLLFIDQFLRKRFKNQTPTLYSLDKLKKIVIKALATYKTLQDSSLPLSYSYLTCDICDSAEIEGTTAGYVCRECGVVLETQKLQYDRPYNDDIIQYAKGLGTTQIGTRRERGISPNYEKLNRLNRHNSRISNEKAVLEQARFEISRIFDYLDLTDYNNIKHMILEKFKEIRSKLRPGLKYRNTDKLVSIITYFCLKLRNVSINSYDLIEVSKISKKEFNDFNLQIQRYLPEYSERNRQDYILQRIFEVSEHFELGMQYYYLAKKIFYRLWNGIKNTTDNVVAGLISSIAVLCGYKDKVSVSAICNRLGIRMSTVQTQVNKKIFEKFHVEGFVSLIKSSNLLVRVMKKLKILEETDIDLEKDEKVPDKVEFVLGSVEEVFNVHENVDYYYFAFSGEYRNPTIIGFKINDFPLIFEREQPLKTQADILLEFEVYRYFKSKDPPIMSNRI